VPRTSQQTAHGRRGFTLLEVLLAVAILTTGLVIVFQGFSTGLRAASFAQKETTAALLAQTLITEIEMEEGVTLGTEEGEFEEDFAGYRWRTDVTESDEAVSGLYEVRIAVLWIDAGRERELTVTKLVAQEF